MSDNKFFVEVMSPRQKRTFVFFAIIWLITLISFWSWWLRAEHFITWTGMVLTGFVLFWGTITPAWYFYFAGRMKRPNPKLPIPKGRVAMIVTKAPSEPWPVVRKTLEAMLTQNFPRKYHVWLADEDPSEETLAWCKSHGVKVGTRKGVAEYHRSEWPRRTKCKEGNLAYFYDTVGYRKYDFVVQMDADHVPTTDYLAEMIRPFADPKVGYVAVPSICDANIKESWVVRARLYAEASMHGSLQAGYNGDGWAPMCIGSHYAVRTAALKQIGGLGPELAEDHTTTLMMNSKGWQGAFAFDAEAHGDGAGSFTDSITQEFQWARSLMNVFLIWTPKWWKGLTPRLKVQFAFAQLWYPMFALQMLFAFAMPAAALLIGLPWVSVDYPQFLWRFWALTLATVVPVIWIQRQGWFRSKDAPVVSWETILFQFVRWPWVVYAVTQSIVAWYLNKQFGFKVTPKGFNGPKPLTLKALWPYLLVVGVNSGAALAVGNARAANGYYYFTLAYSVIYTAVLAVIVGLHVHENRVKLQTERVSPIRFVVKPILVILATVLLVGIVVSLRSPKAVEAITWRLQPAQNVEFPDGKFFGVYDPEGLLSETKLDVEHSFVNWRNPADFEFQILRTRRAGRFPMITIEPWPKGNENVLDAICSGEEDLTVKRLASITAQQKPQTVLVRFAHEMDLEEVYPWAGKPQTYVCAYRRFIDTFRKESADNVLWIWSPAGEQRAFFFYPGDAYVDYIGVTILSDPSWNAGVAGKEDASFNDYLKVRLWVATYFQKPLIVAESGTSNPELEAKRKWLAESVTSWENTPEVVGLVLFNSAIDRPIPNGSFPDWSIDLSVFSSISK